MYSLTIGSPTDANGNSGGFVETKNALWVGTESDKAVVEKAAVALKAKLEAEAKAKAKAAALKKTTITCVKGKLTKKVTAVKPVCPKGYKMKK
jgi:hypothetical protein